MKKISLILIGGLVTMAFAFSALCAENARPLTNIEFSELLVKTIGINLPAGSEKLPDAEYFEVVANVLASRGIDSLLDKNANDPLTAGNMAEVLYALIGGTEDLSSPVEKIRFLADKNLMPYCAADSGVTPVVALEILNNPAFASLVAEAYHAGERRERAAETGAPAAIPEKVEKPVSPI